MKQTVIGVFDNENQATQALQALESSGFSRNQIDLSIQSAGSNTGSSTGISEDQASSDSVGNFFGTLFGDSDQSRSYSQVARQSGSVVTVHAQSTQEAEKAAQILDDSGAIDIDERASQHGFASSDSSLNVSSTDTTASGTSLPIIEEELQVGKRVVQTGGARLRSRIVNVPVEESIRLRSEHIRVERTAVDRPASEADFAAFKEGTLEVTEQAEEAVVAKEARVIEEISLKKEVKEREETVRDTVRSTQVEVENLAGNDVSRSTTGSINATPNAAYSDSTNTTNSLTVTHLFRDRDSLEKAYQYVRHQGYQESEVNVVMTDATRKKHFGEGSGSDLGEKALEGAGTGSAIGGTLGAIVGAIAAIGTSLALPGLGLVVAGPIAAGLAGAGAGGLTGGLLGALAKAGFSDDQAKEYQSGIEQGGILLSVQAHSPHEARSIEQQWRSESRGSAS